MPTPRAPWLAAACQAPAALRGLIPVVTPADYHWGVAYRQGAFQLGQLLGWHMLKAGQAVACRAAAGQDVSAETRELLTVLACPARAYAHLPLRETPAVSSLLPSWRKWLDHEERDSYWTGLSYRDARARVAVPALHVGGWFDLFLGGTLDNFTTLSERAATERARRGQRLIVGAWTHTDRTGTAGELHFGLIASEQAIGLEKLQIDFLRRAVRPEADEEAGPRVRLFVMGDNVWRDEDQWPLARTRWTRWYLHPGGSLSPAGPGHCGAPTSSRTSCARPPRRSEPHRSPSTSATPQASGRSPGKQPAGSAPCTWSATTPASARWHRSPN